MSIGFRSILIFAALLGAGCQDNFPPGITSVVSGEECQGLPAGITQLGYSDLARLRGNEQVVGGGINTGDLLLLGFSKGNQPTTGYSIKVVGAEVVEQTAHFTFAWSTPDESTPVQDKPSSPCQVLGMDSGYFDRVVATDEQGHPLGSGELLVMPTR